MALVSRTDSLVEHIIVHYRWMFVMLLLPVSFLYDMLFYLRNLIVFRMRSAPDKHHEKVQLVQRQIQAYHKSGSKQGMCTARAGWQTISPQNMAYKQRMHQIRIELVDILEVDTEAGFVRCEPLVTMGQLSDTLIRMGWTIPILPELDDLTVGGMVMGTGIETSSHRFGLFQHICLRYEVILSDGSVEICTRESNPDLFYAVPWSYGTLGFLSSVDIQIVPAKKYLRVEYQPLNTLSSMATQLNEELNKEDSAEFVECLVYSKDESVLMTANFTDECESGKLNQIGLWFKPWFFKHVASFLETGPSVEYIPLREYYHRHSRSIFWEIQDIIPFGNSIWFRYLFGWLVPPKISLLKLTQGPTLKRLYEEKHMIQDMLVNIHHLESSIQLFHKEVNIYPIWLCPFKLPADPGMLKTESGKEEMYVDIGVYGVPQVPDFEVVSTTRRVEEFVRSVGGFQMMYADSYMTRSEFRQMFDHKLYDSMRRKYNCIHAFPDVFDKVNKKARSGK